jgi:hypothetical protein
MTLFNHTRSTLIVPAHQVINAINNSCVTIAFQGCLEPQDVAFLVPFSWEIDEFLKINPVDRGEYIAQWHDCDDFSSELYGDASRAGVLMADVHVRIVGMQTTHRCNLTVQRNNWSGEFEVRVIEPQTDGTYQNKDVTILKGTIKSGRPQAGK